MNKYYTTSYFICGVTKNIKIYSGDDCFKVPVSIYCAALKNAPFYIEKFKHEILITIDNYDVPNKLAISLSDKYNEPTGVPIIIFFMYDFTLCKEHGAVPKKYKILNDFDKICHCVVRLATISWCDDMLKQSKSFLNYKQSTIESIKHMVKIIRALFTKDNTIFGGLSERINLIKKYYPQIRLPPSYNNWMLLPVPNKTEILKKLHIHNDQKLYINSYQLQYKSGYIYDTQGELNVTNNEVIDKQTDLLLEIISREVELLCYKFPKLFKIPYYEYDCQLVTMTLMDACELIIDHPTKQHLTICDIFRYGLDIVNE